MDRKRLLRNPLVWVAIVILAFLGFSALMDDTRGYTQVPTSVALAQIESRNVAEATIEDKEQRLRLDLTNPVDGNTKIITRYPAASTNGIFTQLQESGVAKFGTVVNQESI